jgi:hypothetical protein
MRDLVSHPYKKVGILAPFFFFFFFSYFNLEGRGCIQKFPDWPPRERTANGTALCH